MTSVQTRAIGDGTGLVIDATSGSVSIPHGGLPPEPAVRVGSGRRHLEKRRRRRADARRRAAQRTPATRHSAPRHSASRPASSGHAPTGHTTGPGDPERRTRRLAALLVVLTLGYGVMVGVLLSPRSGTVWQAARRVGLAPAEVGASAGDPPAGGSALAGAASGVTSALTSARLPGGPMPLPAEVSPLPVGLSIPAIGVNEQTLVPLGRGPDGTMEVPEDYNRAGWFTGGPAPGTPGPAVIAGHVDSHSGPAVFFRLRELKPGDVVTVLLDNGRRARFVVDGVALYSKDDFPTETVFGPVPGVALRLITCGGSFDRIARSYRSNVVVYASQHGPAG